MTDVAFKIQGIVDNIFDGVLEAVDYDVIEVIETLATKILGMNEKLFDNWSRILSTLMKAIENRDYLLISDVLQFEILPEIF